MKLNYTNDEHQSPSNSVVRINEQTYLNIKITTKSQLLHSDYSHYTSYQELLYKLVLRLQVRGLGYRKISEYLNNNGYKTIRGCQFKNTHVFSIIKKGNMRRDRIKKLKSHKDYGYKYELSLSEV